ncbi:UNVERIFIED_CONTAM: hypothetical protein PYX00_007391 [Menopon gallinae]|uniref:Uncharacterized protein n=1 Tax=Menopon gallinae TaxID=328185 RepID=A0AAW2HJN9_9NEOP
MEIPGLRWKSIKCLHEIMHSVMDINILFGYVTSQAESYLAGVYCSRTRRDSGCLFVEIFNHLYFLHPGLQILE